MRQKFFYSIPVGILALGLIFFSRTAPVALVRSGIMAIFRPVFEISHALGRAAIFSAGQPGGDDLSRLREDNQRLREIEQEYRMLLEKDASLQKMVGLKEKQRVSLRGARVLLHGNEFGREFLLLDQGSAQKIRQGDLAVDGDGNLVGVVREAGDQFTKVSIASNPGETFEVAVAPLGTKALAKGIGNRTFSLELIPDDTPVRPGDFALVPGRLGATGMSVGEITSVTSSSAGAFQNVRASLIARPEILDEVFIIVE